MDEPMKIEKQLQRALDQIQSDDWYSFDVARDVSEADSYVNQVLAREDQVGVLQTACEDLADAVGALDYGDVRPGLLAVIQQWRKAADDLPAYARDALRLRLVANQLADLVDDPEFDDGDVPDLVSLILMKDEFAALAVAWQEASDKSQWLMDNAARLMHLSGHIELGSYMKDYTD